MAKIPIIRPGAKRPVMMDRKIAERFVKAGRFQHASNVIPKPKRKAKIEDETGRVTTQEGPVNRPKEVKEKAVVQTQKEAMTPSELRDMTFADLKTLAAKRDVPMNPGESKEDLVGRIYRYMRRDMRASQ